MTDHRPEVERLLKVLSVSSRAIDLKSYDCLRGLLDQIATLEAELVELKERDRIISHHLERRADGADPLTKHLRETTEAALAQVATLTAERDALLDEMTRRNDARAQVWHEREVAEAKLYALRSSLGQIRDEMRTWRDPQLPVIDWADQIDALLKGES